MKSYFGRVPKREKWKCFWLKSRKAGVLCGKSTSDMNINNNLVPVRVACEEFSTSQTFWVPQQSRDLFLEAIATEIHQSSLRIAEQREHNGILTFFAVFYDPA